MIYLFFDSDSNDDQSASDDEDEEEEEVNQISDVNEVANQAREVHVPAIKCIRRRHRKIVVNETYATQVINKEIKWPEAIRQFFPYFEAIDIHDHYRQGILEMERNWLTKKLYRSDL